MILYCCDLYNDKTTTLGIIDLKLDWGHSTTLKVRKVKLGKKKTKLLKKLGWVTLHKDNL